VTTFLIDLAVLGTIVFCGWRGFKSGLIRGVFGVVSLVVALLIANIAAQAYSGDTKGMILPFVSGIIESTMTDLADDGIEYQPVAHDHESEEANFGTAYVALRQLGLPEAAAVRIAEQAIEVEEDERGRYFSDTIAEKLSGAFSYVAVFGIAFLLLSIVFAVVGNLVGVVFALPGLKYVDMIAGTVFGLFKGFIIVYTVAVILRYFGLMILPTIDRTTVLKYIINNNPIANMLGV
jgi:uncharacterized membrane protein required for colicin V production